MRLTGNVTRLVALLAFVNCTIHEAGASTVTSPLGVLHKSRRASVNSHDTKVPGVEISALAPTALVAEVSPAVTKTASVAGGYNGSKASTSSFAS